jgi:hypothetical protein
MALSKQFATYQPMSVNSDIAQRQKERQAASHTLMSQFLDVDFEQDENVDLFLERLHDLSLQL